MLAKGQQAMDDRRLL